MRAMYLSWAQERFPLAFYAMIGAGFLAPSVPVWALLFYVLFLPLLIVRWASGAGRLRLSFSAMAAFLFVLWSMLAIFWGDDAAAGMRHGTAWIIDGVCTLAFLLAGIDVQARDDRFLHRLQTVLIATSAVSSTVSLLAIALSGHLTDRHGGFGITRPPITGAIVTGIPLLLALGHVALKRRLSWFYALAIMLDALMMVMTDSRGPLVAILLPVLLLVASAGWRLGGKLIAVMAVGLAGLVCLAPHLFAHLLHEALTRGSSFRFVIWRDALSEIAQAPVAGHGPAATLGITVGDLAHPHPHNLYLAILLYSGVVGLLLFAGAFIRPFSWALRSAWRSEGHVLLCVLLFVALAGLTDISQPIKGPADIWYILWVPWLLSLAGCSSSAPKADAP